jgi:hypothetical protein
LVTPALRALGAANGRGTTAGLRNPADTSILIMTDKKIPVDRLPQAVDAAASELSNLSSGITDNALAQALPAPDILFGGAVLLLVVMFHAFGIRAVTSSFLNRMQYISARAILWRAEVLFAWTVLALLLLHLAEVIIWSAALVWGGMIPDWARAAYFSANCYTALGEPFALAHTWRIVPPIIAMSGIFTFAWTASVLVNFVARYNDVRASIIATQQQRKAGHKRAS